MEINITEGICGEIKWFDMFGNEHKVDAGEKSFAMELSVDPKFILADSMSEEWGRQPQLSLHRIAHTAKTTHHKPV